MIENVFRHFHRLCIKYLDWIHCMRYAKQNFINNDRFSTQKYKPHSKWHKSIAIHKTEVAENITYLTFLNTMAMLIQKNTEICNSGWQCTVKQDNTLAYVHINYFRFLNSVNYNRKPEFDVKPLQNSLNSLDRNIQFIFVNLSENINFVVHCWIEFNTYNKPTKLLTYLHFNSYQLKHTKK